MASSANALALVRVIGSQQFVYGLSDEIDRRISEGGVSAGVATFNTRSGAVSLTSGDVTTALTFTPYNATNPSGYQTAANVAGIASTTKIIDYTLALVDAGTVVEANLGTAISITVPPNASVAFPIGTTIELYAMGAGTVTVVAGAGVTLRNPNATLGMRAQFSSASLRKRAADEWVVSGDFA